VKNKLVGVISHLTSTTQQVRSDLLLLNFTIANACIISELGSNKDQWVLVDTGLENSGKFILKTVQKHFGANSKPQAIILTHGHFDHIGSVKQLIKKWQVPVYIHKWELPYVTGKQDYLPGDPTVDNGFVAKLSPTFPHTSIDLGNSINSLPEDGTIPFLPDWKWILVPGHTKGQIALFRESDRTLLCADAFTTVKQESLISVLLQQKKVSGPPKYFTTNWPQAKQSIEKIIDLKPNLVIASHGKPIESEILTEQLQDVLANIK